MSIPRYLCAVLIASPVVAQQPIALREQSSPDRVYAIQANVEVTGTLTLAAEKGKASSVGINGRSTIAYNEKLLSPLADGAARSIRIYRQAEFRRTISGQAQESTIRAAVRRMVVLRSGTREVPFSPDGPLTFGEINIVSTDVYTSALVGLLPAQPVAAGDIWPAALSAVEEITDFERVEQGGLECRFVGVEGRVAKVAFTGSVSGVNEDGPVRQQLDGHFTFDLDANLITGLNFTGIKSLLDGQGKTTGRIEGKFSLLRTLAADAAELSELRLRGLTLEPNPTNTLLYYEAAGAAARFTYPRRWRVSAEQGRQITLDGPQGNGLLITVEPSEKVPAVTAYAREAQDFVVKQKGRVVKAEPPTKLRPYPQEVDRFGMDIELNSQPARMEYAVIRQSAGGATLAARLLPTDAANLRTEVEQIAKSIQVGPATPAGVVPLPGK
jgi:hypothetical protein